MTGGVGVIDGFTDTFSRYIDSGFGLIHGEVAFLATTLVGIDMALAGLFWAWGVGEDALQRLVKKILFVGMFAFIIGNFNSLAAIIFNSFAGIGLEAAGSGVSASDFVHPGKIAQVGLDAGAPILTAAGQLMGPVSFFDNFVLVFVLLLAWLIVLLSFFIIAIQLFVTLIEFKLTTLAGFVLIPFGLFAKSAFLAEKVLGNIVASGVKVMVLAVIVGIGTTLFSQFTTGFPTDPNIEDALSIALGALTILGLSIFGPGIATGLISGAPQLGASAAVGTGLVVAGIGAAAGAGITAGVGAVAGAAGAAGGGGAAAAGGSIASRPGPTGSGGPSPAGGGPRGPGPGAPSSGAAAAPAGGFPSGGSESGGSGSGGSGSGGPSSAAGAPNAPAGPPPADDDAAMPEWAQRLKRRQDVSHGVTAAAHGVRAGDHAGGGASVSLSED